MADGIFEASSNVGCCAIEGQAARLFNDWIPMTSDVMPSQAPGLLSSLLELVKFRISVASTFTAAAGYIAFRRGADLGLVTTLLGILLLAMGSCALNEVQEHEFDAQMERTRNRPIPRGAFTAQNATLIALALAASGFLMLLLAHNLAAALLGALAMLWYNGFYTPLKRVSAFAVVPGSVIGALPPAIGWCAAGGALQDPGVLALAFVYFIWQVPHFWLLVALHHDGYEGAGFPTLMTLFGKTRLARLTFTWTCGTAAACALLPVFRIVQAKPALGLLLVAALWLVVTGLPLLRRDLTTRDFRRAFMNINIFALALTGAVILDVFLGG
jgi:protoheme IX farnesyltransferase